MLQAVRLTLLILFSANCIFAQESFFHAQETIFSNSENQWLCRELHKGNSSHFAQKKTDDAWIIPESEEFVLFGTTIKTTKENRDHFQKLLFPKDDVKRYKTLLSLCDLYLPLFRKDCEAANLPEEFKYLPLILSGGNQSFSDAHDHAGLWAMDYLTARKFHLRIDTLVDERRGGDFSTHAATSYLKELFVRYDGDAVRTILAYKLGVPAIHHFPDDIKGEALIEMCDSSTQLFFQCYAYFVNIIKTTRTANQLTAYFDIMANFEPIVITKEVKMQALEEILKVNLTDLRQFNPVFIGSTLQVGYRKTPFMMDKVSALKFEALSDSIYNWQPGQTASAVAVSVRQEEITYKVKRGDSLGKIADKFHVSIREIKKWNGLKGDRISKGQKLKIIRKTEAPSVKPLAKVESKPEGKNDQVEIVNNETINPSITETELKIQQLEKEAEALIKKKAYDDAIKIYFSLIEISGDTVGYEKKIKATEQKKKAQLAKPTQTTYVVKSGDSLWKIARKYPGVTENDLKKWNKCGDDIRPGQKLIIHPKK